MTGILFIKFLMNLLANAMRLVNLLEFFLSLPGIVDAHRELGI